MIKKLLLLFFYIIKIVSCNVNVTNYENFNENDWDNATWVLTSSFIIITMQSGFGLLESGLVSKKNNSHIMIKNISDIIFGGLTFWIFGYSIIFGEKSNGFASFNNFFLNENKNFGWLYANFFFQLTFSTTATTIVSGCLAERTKFSAYVLFSSLNTFIYIFPAHWIWNKNGWLKQLGVIDYAGAGPVHLMGGITGLVGTIMLGPRLKINKPSSPVNSILGLFMLWWGWLGFNCGSTQGITQYMWLYASKAAVTTVIASIGGGILGIFYSYYVYEEKLLIEIIINSILGSLVSITSCCIYVSTPESFVIGIIGALVAIKGNDLIKNCGIDDPVGAIGVHTFSSYWGLIASGLFSKSNIGLSIKNGLFYGGGFYLLGIQLLEIISITLWSLVLSFIFFKLIDITIGLRLSPENEIIGADTLYHLENNDEVEIIDINNTIDNAIDNDNDNANANDNDEDEDNSENIHQDDNKNNTENCVRNIEYNNGIEIPNLIH